MTILTPEIVEKAARVLFYAEWSPAKMSAKHLEGEWDDSKEYWAASARTALEAALPDLIEAVADNLDTQYLGLEDLMHAKAAIRSLTKTESENG